MTRQWNWPVNMPAGVLANTPAIHTQLSEVESLSSQQQGSQWNSDYNSLVVYLNGDVNEGFDHAPGHFARFWNAPTTETNGHEWKNTMLTITASSRDPVAFEKTIPTGTGDAGGYIAPQNDPTGSVGTIVRMYREKSNPKRGFVHFRIPVSVQVTDEASSSYNISIEVQN